MTAEDWGYTPMRPTPPMVLDLTDGMPTAPKRAVAEPVRPKRAENLLAEVLGTPAPRHAMPRRAR